MAVSLKHFVTQIVESGVLSTAEITEFQQAQTTAAETAEELAKQLVEQKKLTKYQSQLINQGKGDRLVLGSYVILNVIGVGGMGQVFLAEHRRMKRRVALKTLPADLTDDQQAIRRFHREVQAAAKLTHPNIVTAFDADEDKGIHYFAMEYVSGIDLADNVRSHGVLSVSRAVDYILQAAKGLEYAHSKGVVHRDIKPANMLLDYEGTIKILDMGLARVDNAANEKAATALTQAGNMMGTVDYMAPEQARDSHTADARSDIYSLGCTLHYLLTAESVYGGDTLVNRILAHRDHPIPSLTAKVGHVPASLDAVFRKMVAKEPTDRYQTVGEVIRDIQACGLLDQSDSPATIRTEPADPALADFLNSQTEDVTRTLVMADEMPPAPNGSDTLQSGFLDNTLSGGAPATQRRSRKSADKRVWIATGVVLAAVLILVGLFLNRDSAKGTLVLEIDQPELAGAVVTVDGQNRVTIQSGQVPKPIEIAADGKQHTLKVTKQGFAPFDKQFTVQADQQQTIKVRLMPLKVETNETITPTPYIGDNYALSFDGKRGWVGVGDWKIDPKSPLTYEATVRPRSFTDEGARSILGWSGSSNILFQEKTNNRLTVHWYQGADRLDRIDSGIHLQENRTVSVAVVWDGSTAALYMNGKRQPETLKAATWRNANTFAIGGQAPPPFHGIIDEIRVSNIARYTQDYSPVTRFENDDHTLALYHCDEGHWDILNDSSGNNHHGKIVDAKWVKVDDELREIDAPKTSGPHRRAAEMVLRRGGSVTYVTPSALKTITKPSQLPPERLALYSMNLTDCDSLSDADWRTLAGVKRLLDFIYTGKPISLAGIKAVRQVGSFQHLNLSYSELNDARVAQLEALEDIHSLSLGGNSALTDAAFASIAKMSTLRKLHISPTSISTAGLKSLARLPHLRSLSISHSTGLSGSSLAELLPLQSLQVLELIDTDVNDAAVPSFTKLQSLRLLDLVKTAVTDEAAVRLQSLLPNCSIIHPAIPTSDADRRAAQWTVDNGGSVHINTATGGGHETLTERVFAEGPFAVSRITFNANTLPPAAIADFEGLRSIHAITLPTLDNPDVSLASCKHLTSLLAIRLDSSDVTAAGLAHLQGLSQLEQLHLSDCQQAAGNALAGFSSFKHLWLLSLSRTPISDDRLEHVGKLRSLRNLYLEDCPQLTGRGFQNIVSLSKLTHLSLTRSPVTDEAIPYLQQMPSLRVLHLTGTKITAAAAAKLQAALPDCVVFHESLNELPWQAASVAAREWPKDQPDPAVAPFNPVEAQQHQQAWATHLGQPLEKEIDLGKGQSLPMVLIPPGEFLMGSTDAQRADAIANSDADGRFPVEGPQHQVRITQPFWLGRHEVTHAQFRRFVEETGYKTDVEKNGKGGHGFLNRKWTRAPQFVWNADLGYPRTDNHPVVNVTWNDATAYCRWLSKQQDEWVFTLPTEAQWEYACRAGTTTHWQSGNDQATLHQYGWLEAKSGLKTHPVGLLKSNAFGLFDMHGNVFEWCADNWAEHYYAASPRDDPTGSPKGTQRVIRGGNWRSHAEHCRSASREGNVNNDLHLVHDLGFRVAMTFDASKEQELTTDPQRRAAEMLLAGGESFSIFQAAGGSKQISSRQQLPQERFALYTLDLSRGNPLTAAEWKAFEGVKSLVRLQMLDAPVSPAGFQQLQAIDSLRHLNLNNAQLTDADLVEIAELTDLWDLNVSNNPNITDKACDALLRLTELRELQITGTSITGAGLKTLSQLPHLFSLQLNLSSGISAADLAALASLESLDTLTLWDGPVDDEVIDYLAKVKSLRVIRLRYTKVSNEGAARLQQLLPECSILHPNSKTAAGDLKAAKWVIENGGSLRIYGGQFLPYRKLPPDPFALKQIDFPSANPPGSGSEQIAGINSLETLNWFRLSDADAELASIGKLTTLRSLNISMSNVTATGLSHLKELNHLENLTLSACPRVDDDALVHLSANRLLRHLVLNQTPLTDKGLAALGQVSNLWDLRLESCPHITGSGLANLVTPLKLRRLSFIKSPITDEAIPHLQQMKSLRVLNLTGTRVTAAAAVKLQAALPDCVVFHESLANVPKSANTEK